VFEASGWLRGDRTDQQVEVHVVNNTAHLLESCERGQRANGVLHATLLHHFHQVLFVVVLELLDQVLLVVVELAELGEIVIHDGFVFLH